MCCFVGAYFIDELLDVIEVLRGERPEHDLYQDVCSNTFGFRIKDEFSAFWLAVWLLLMDVRHVVSDGRWIHGAGAAIE